ncbi:MAG: hypothetical protein AAF699_17765 [Pseudomonadota bacterium]
MNSISTRRTGLRCLTIIGLMFSLLSVPAKSDTVWSVKAILMHDTFWDVKAIGTDGDLIDVKAFEEVGNPYILDVKAIQAGKLLPIKIVSNETPFAPVKAIQEDGTILDIKAISPEGQMLDVKGTNPNGKIFDIKAIAPDGELIDIKAISPDNRVRDIKGLKMHSEEIEGKVFDVEFFANIKALTPP